MLFKHREKCFCAFCKTPRHVYVSKYLGIFAIIGLAGLSFVLTVMVWETLDVRGLFIFAPILLMGELFSQAKWRQSMVCKNCGFDVITYKKDPEKCGEKIKEHLARRGERPEFLLKPLPQIPASAYAKAPLVAKTSSTTKKGDKLSLQV